MGATPSNARQKEFVAEIERCARERERMGEIFPPSLVKAKIVGEKYNTEHDSETASIVSHNLPLGPLLLHRVRLRGLGVSVVDN